MMIKYFLALLLVLHTAFDVWIYQCMWKQRRKPLPASVADVYDETRYQTFIDYKTDCRKQGGGRKAIFLEFSCLIQLQKILQSDILVVTRL